MARYLSSETQPYGKWKGIPIYLTTILAAVLVVGLFLSATLFAAQSPLLYTLTFAQPADSGAEIIGAFTYPFIERVSFFTPFMIFFFYWLAVGVESHLGRPVLGKLLAALVLVPVVVGAVLWYAMGIPTLLSGTFLISAALIIAFATLYPNVEWMGWIPFKWVAFACFVCGSLMQISARDWTGLVALWANCGAAFLIVRHAIEAEHDDYIPLGARIRAFFGPRRKFRVVPREPHTLYRERDRTVRPELRDDFADMEAEMDKLLEKIAKTGLDSLTPAERTRLEKAREALMKKERR